MSWSVTTVLNHLLNWKLHFWSRKQQACKYGACIKQIGRNYGKEQDCWIPEWIWEESTWLKEALPHMTPGSLCRLSRCPCLIILFIPENKLSQVVYCFAFCCLLSLSYVLWWCSTWSQTPTTHPVSWAKLLLIGCCASHHHCIDLQRAWQSSVSVIEQHN